MQVILIVASATGLIVGSLAFASLFCWVFWDVGKAFRHPEWVAWAVLTVLALSLAGKLPNSEFARLALLFSLVGAVPLWFAGRAWRRQQDQNFEEIKMQRARLEATRSEDQAIREPPSWTYPVITACLSEDRSPTRDERNQLARRLWLEALERRVRSAPKAATFGERRILSRATDAALRGHGRTDIKTTFEPSSADALRRSEISDAS